MTQINHLDQLAVIQLDFDIWSGQVKLEAPDIKLGDGGELPPATLAGLGRKFVIDKEHLRPFSRLKTKARRLCLSVGMSFMNGFAVPVDKIDEVSVALDEIGIEMETLKSEFLDAYDQHIEEWVLDNPGYSSAIRAGALHKSELETRLGFDYQVFKVNPFDEKASQKLNSMASGLADELLDEIVEEANSFFYKSLQGKRSCQSNTRKTLQRLRDKVDGLSFLDPRFHSIVTLLSDTVAGYANQGRLVSGEQFYRVMSAVLILSSKDKIESYADGNLDVSAMAHGFMSSSVEATQEVTARMVEPEPAFEEVKPNIIDDAAMPVEEDVDAFFQKPAGLSNDMYF